jgi:hypothetical protein
MRASPKIVRRFIRARKQFLPTLKQFDLTPRGRCVIRPGWKWKLLHLKTGSMATRVLFRTPETTAISPSGIAGAHRSFVTMRTRFALTLRYPAGFLEASPREELRRAGLFHNHRQRRKCIRADKSERGGSDFGSGHTIDGSLQTGERWKQIVGPMSQRFDGRNYHGVRNNVAG